MVDMSLPSRRTGVSSFTDDVIAGLNGAKRFVWLSGRIPKEGKIKSLSCLKK